MLNSPLNTNEIKNSLGVEVEFERLSSGPGRETVFRQINESPSLQHRITIKHSETGTGINRRRRSVVRFDKTIIATVDSVTPVTISKYDVLDAPVGALTASTEIANVIAEAMSFFASTGSDSTIKFDCTGNGAKVLLNGDL
jgi:hypothetical protein